MKKQAKVVEYNLNASEFSWEIAPGKTIEAWGFNKQLPGPTLKASVGDTLVVRITNNLKEPTLIHWHGLRIPATMDGTGAVQNQLNPVKFLSTAFYCLMLERFGITHMLMKQYNWRKECMVH